MTENMTIVIGFLNFFTEFQEFRGVKSYKLRENHQYHDQVQGQLHITGKSVCDFMVWTPKDCAIVRITKQLSWEAFTLINLFLICNSYKNIKYDNNIFILLSSNISIILTSKVLSNFLQKRILKID